MKLLSISDDKAHAVIEVDERDAVAICNMVVGIYGLFSVGDVHSRIGVTPDHLERMYTAADEILARLRGRPAG